MEQPAGLFIDAVVTTHGPAQPVSWRASLPPHADGDVVQRKRSQ